MSAKDLIAEWEDALAQAQLAASPSLELNDEDLEAAAVSGIATRSGLRAGQDPCGEDSADTFFCIFGHTWAWGC